MLHSAAVATVATMSKQTLVRMGVNSLARMSPSTGAVVAEVAQQVEEQPRHAQKPRKVGSSLLFLRPYSGMDHSS